MADSEVRQKFEARKWCDEHRKHPIIGKAIQGAQSWQPDGLAEIVAYIQDEAYSAGMRAGEIAMREKAAQALESRPYYSNQTPDAIRALPLSGAQEKKP